MHIVAILEWHEMVQLGKAIISRLEKLQMKTTLRCKYPVIIVCLVPVLG